MANMDDVVKAAEANGRSSLALDLITWLADDAIKLRADGGDDRANYARELMNMIVELRDKK